MPGLHFIIILIDKVAQTFPPHRHHMFPPQAFEMRFMRAHAAQSRAFPKLLECAVVHIKPHHACTPFVSIVQLFLVENNSVVPCYIMRALYIYYTRVTNTVLGLVQYLDYLFAKNTDRFKRRQVQEFYH